MRKKGLWFVLLLLFFAWPASTVLAGEPTIYADDGQIFVDEDVSLEPGQVFDGDLGVFSGDLIVPDSAMVRGDVFVTNGNVEIAGQIDGDLAVIDGDLTLAAGGQVRGDVFGMGGDKEIAGQVNGDLAAMFGNVDLRDTAIVKGDLTIVSGNLTRAGGAQVYGQEIPNLRLPGIEVVPRAPEMPQMPEIPPIPTVPSVPSVPRGPSVPTWPREVSLGHQIGRFVGRTMAASVMTLLFVGLGLLVFFVWPRPTRRVAECITVLPVQSFGLGLLTFLLAAGLEAVAAVLMILLMLIAAALIGTVVLIPIGLLLILLSVLILLPVPLALTGAMVLGWVGLAQVVGQKVLTALRAREIKPLGEMLVGLLLTAAVAAILWVLKPACCAWPFVILMTSVGLGAVFHTRFGRQGCQPAPAPTAQPPAAADEVLPPEAMDEEAGQPDQPPAGTP